MHCPECGCEFVPLRHNQRFCSHECYTKFWAKRYSTNQEFRKEQNKRVKAYRLKHPIETWAWKAIDNHVRRGWKIGFRPEYLIERAKTVSICRYCGTKLKFHIGDGKGWKPDSASLDIFHGSLMKNHLITGYDIQIICARCNNAKHEMDDAMFLAHCKVVSERN